MVLLVFALTCCAQASVLLDTGYIGFSATGSQFGRISRDGVSSVWGDLKPFPGVTGAPALRGYETFTINSGLNEFLQISLDDPLAVFFVAAYMDAYSPLNSPPNFGLNIHYLGDPGSSQPFGNPSFFQIQVPRFSQVVIPINEVNPGGGTGVTFNLIVEGFADANFGEVPEPVSLWLCTAGLALLAMMRARRSAGRSRHPLEGGLTK